MTRDQAKTLWPIVKAYGEGKTIKCDWGTNEEDFSILGENANFDILDYNYKFKIVEDDK